VPRLLVRFGNRFEGFGFERETVRELVHDGNRTNFAGDYHAEQG
jgi:hypothetical protein